MHPCPIDGIQKCDARTAGSLHGWRWDGGVSGERQEKPECWPTYFQTWTDAALFHSNLLFCHLFAISCRAAGALGTPSDGEKSQVMMNSISVLGEQTHVLT